VSYKDFAVIKSVNEPSVEENKLNLQFELPKIVEIDFESNSAKGTIFGSVLLIIVTIFYIKIFNAYK
jgi:hypothetical protein